MIQKFLIAGGILARSMQRLSVNTVLKRRYVEPARAGAVWEEGPMNHNDARNLFSHPSASLIGEKLVVFIATGIFWLIILALLSCPAWLPGLVEHSISH